MSFEKAILHGKTRRKQTRGCGSGHGCPICYSSKNHKFRKKLIGHLQECDNLGVKLDKQRRISKIPA